MSQLEGRNSTDFDPDEADEIAEEMKASAAAARGITKK